VDSRRAFADQPRKSPRGDREIAARVSKQPPGLLDGYLFTNKDLTGSARSHPEARLGARAGKSDRVTMWNRPDPRDVQARAQTPRCGNGAGK
jgi:hypothetical protein